MSRSFLPRHIAAGAFGLLVAAAIESSPAAAQPPSAWLQTSVGVGFAGRRNDYNSNIDITGQLRGGVRLGSMLGVELSGLVTTPLASADQITNAICYVDVAHPDICLPVPTPAHFAIAGAGASLVYGRSNSTRLSIGAGSYVLSKYISTRSSTRALGILGGADMDLFATHPKITLGVHPVLMPNVRGTYEWFLPFEIGVRAW